MGQHERDIDNILDDMDICVAKKKDIVLTPEDQKIVLAWFEQEVIFITAVNKNEKELH